MDFIHTIPHNRHCKTALAICASLCHGAPPGCLLSVSAAAVLDGSALLQASVHAPMKGEELTSQSTNSSGIKCTSEEVHALIAMGNGKSPKSLPRVTATCGLKSFNWVIDKLVEGDFINCFQKSTRVSELCSECFLGETEYAMGACQGPCAGHWCSKSCVACTDKYRNVLTACVGHNTPKGEPC